MEPTKRLFDNKGEESPPPAANNISEATANILAKLPDPQKSQIPPNRYRRSSGRADGKIFGVLFFLALIAAFILWLCGCNFGAVNEGVVSYDDCRSTITLQSGDWDTYFGQYTCSYIKTEKGVVMGGECVRVVNDGSLFSSSHTCATAYIYSVPQANVCTNPTYPYLGYDDKCYTTQQY